MLCHIKEFITLIKNLDAEKSAAKILIILDSLVNLSDQIV